MSAAFTPGPWRLRVVNRASGVPCGFNILYPEEAGKPDVAIASVYTHGGADARLIAAAPELYAELEKCVDHSCTCDECNRLRAVLARARGEQ